MEHVSHQDGGWSSSQTWPTKRMWARIVCGVFASSRCAEPAQKHRARRCYKNEPKQPERCGEKGKQKDDA